MFKLNNPNEFVERRLKFFDQLPDNSIAVVTTNSELIRSNDSDFHFRPNSDFYYLTGVEEPGSAAVFVKNQDDTEFHLFVRPKDKAQEIWHGRRVGVDLAKEIFSADATYQISKLDEVVGHLIGDRDALVLSGSRQTELSVHVDRWSGFVYSQRKQGVRMPEIRLDLDPIVAELRVIKSPVELELMRAASEISAHAHCRAMRYTKPGVTEYQIEAEINHEFAISGARHPAYNSIVGSGDNACILHYVDNSMVVDDGKLVLIDAGCEYQMYAADITRTFPANGRFNEEQKALYEIVLDAETAAIEQVKPGNSYNLVHDTAVRVIVEGLVSLGLMQGDIDELIATEAYKEFYMHGTGHWLGIDVHDVGDYRKAGTKEWREFKPGMVLTVEPGIYVSPDNLGVDQKWRGIGIRIEDDILVTESGNEVLTFAVPKTIAEIESLMQA